VVGYTGFQTLLLLAQAATPTPDEIGIRVLDDGRGDLGLRDLIVPLGTLGAALVGGLGGVLIGGRMNRTTLSTLEGERAVREAEREQERAEREDRLDQRRAEREQALADVRHQRDEALRRRQALGALRLLAVELERVRSHVDVEVGLVDDLEESIYSDPLIVEGEREEVVIQPEHLMQIAMWVSAGNWRRITWALDQIENMARERADARSGADAKDAEGWKFYGENAKFVREWIDRALDAVKTELEVV
jgi:hypothetical protein